MRNFKRRSGFHLSNEMAQLYGERIDQIAKNGEITATELLQDAISPASPLHGWFNWKNALTANGKENLLYRARTLLRALDVQVPGREYQTTRAYPFINKKYVDCRVALADEKMATELVKRAQRELDSSLARYEVLLEIVEGGAFSG